MPNAVVVPDAILNRSMTELADVISDSGHRRREFLPLVMGPLAALLIIKWVGRDESERQSLRELYEALDDTYGFLEGDLDNDELEREWEQPAEVRFLQSLTEVATNERAMVRIDMSENRAAARPKARHVARVAPLLLDVADTPFLRLALSQAGRIDMETREGRASALQRFDEQLLGVQKFSGESTTPAAVADLMLELARPGPSEKVYDPCFGFGGLLLAAARRLHAAARTGPSRAGNDEESCDDIFGIEINRLSYAIGLCRTVLAGIERPLLELGNALDTRLPADGFDCVLATPPWGMIAARSSAGPTSSPGAHSEAAASPRTSVPESLIRSRHSDDMFLQHVMANLRPGGRAVVALPQSSLFRSGVGRRVREALVSGYRVDAVLSLPPHAFTPYTRVRMNLVVFRRHEPGPSVRFVSVSQKAWNTAPRDDREDRGRGGLQHSLADLVHVTALAETTIPGGVEAWDVSVHELARRGYELIAKKTGRDALAADLDQVVAADRSVRVERLEHVAEVCSGPRYIRAATTDDRARPDVVAGLVRLRDVTDAGIRAPSRFLIDSKGLVKETDILRGGDVVVTISGAVGKVGLISEATGAVGSIATGDMAVVRELRGVTPNFLVALLRSPTYQNWLSGHARGAAVERLSTQTLRNLPIPLPPAPVQDAMLDELGGSRGDALGVLARLLTRKERSALAVWLEGPFVAKLAAGSISDAPNGSKALSDATDALVSLDKHVAVRAERAFPSDRNQRTGAWLGAAGQAAAALDGVVSIPSGAGRLAVLELGRARLYEALHTLDAADGPTFDRLRSVTRGMTRILDEEIEAMQESVTLRIGVEPDEVAVGAVSEVQLRLTNASKVPLRNVRVDARLIEVRPSVGRDATRPPVCDVHIAYLADGETRNVPMNVNPSEATQPVGISVSWRAQRLDGTTVREAKQVEVQVRTTHKRLRPRDLGSSPYIVGSPVDRREMFFGRAGVMERIRRQLGTHANVILLEGNRRTGKTSILRQLKEPDALSGWIPVYCSFQDAEGDAKGGIATHNVFRLLARTTGWALWAAGVETWFPELPARDPGRRFELAFRDALKKAFAEDHPFEVFALYIAAAIEASSPRRILLMLDEFDKLQEGIEAGITSPQVPENIRHLLQHQAGLSAIITGSRRLKRLREEYWSALFGLGHRIPVSELPVEEARRLVTKPVEGMLEYLPQACHRVVELCACQPFLVQSLCNRVFEQLAVGNSRIVTLDIVEEAATGMVRDNEHFRTLWGYAGTARRRLLLMLCERLSEGPDTVNLDLLEAQLNEHRVPVSRRDLTSDITELRELELIDLDNSYRRGSYRLAVPLMARWLQVNVDFEEAVVQARDEAIEARW